jgi:hypothetical protein
MSKLGMGAKVAHVPVAQPPSDLHATGPTQPPT